MMIIKNQNTVPLVRKRAFLSDISGSAGRSIFSIKRADGARRVPLAVDIIAERSAPKNITCTNTGVASKISEGNTLWVSSVPVTRSGAIINAANPSIIGRNATIT
jgi:hypothetical protein